MKAAVLEKIGEPLKVQEVELPQLEKGEVLVKVKASSINHRDIWISKGMYANIQLPCILGSDASGEVVEVGSEADKIWKGKEVIINPNINWGENEAVQSKNYQILGMPSQGTFAEFVKVKVDRLVEKPKHLSHQEAATLPLGGLTAYRALVTKGAFTSSKRVLINGAGGGVAQLAFQFALAIGGSVFVTSGSQEKIDKAIELGAKGGISYKEEGWGKKFKSNFGEVDLIIDSAGGKGFNEFQRIMAPGGKVVFYGGTLGNIEKLSPQILFWKQVSLLGTTMGSDQDFANMISFINQSELKPTISKGFPLAEVNEAFKYIENQNQFGKVVLS